jgi:starch synthase
MNVLLASMEVSPFAKVGGLADVAGSLPKALHDLGVDVRVVMPKHLSVQRFAGELKRVPHDVVVNMPAQVSGCGVDEARLPNSDVPVYFIEHHDYFTREGVYGPPGGAYADNLERLSFFCRAAMAFPKVIGWEPEVFHLNDWHTSLIAAYARAWGLSQGTLFTGHNLGGGYQGAFPEAQIGVTGLDLAHPLADKYIANGLVNLARLGLVFADLVNVVSEGYAREIESPEQGAGIDDLVVERRADVKGILNGIDYGEWNPTTDKSLPATFGPQDLAGKAVCKAKAQAYFGLPVDPDVPLMTMITRLDAQKGFDLVAQALPEFEGFQFAVLGTGDPRYEKMLQAAAGRPNIAAHIGFDPKLARLIYAGSDMFLMPSRYEPCGLGQMIALAYGTIPIVRATGGLADTITEEGKKPNGFAFEEYTATAMVAAIKRALATYADPVVWSKLMADAFASDFSWNVSAKRYAKLYEAAAKRGARRGKL